MAASKPSKTSPSGRTTQSGTTQSGTKPRTSGRRGSSRSSDELSASTLRRWALLVCGGPVAIEIAALVLRGEADGAGMAQLALVAVACLLVYATPKWGLPVAVAVLFSVGVKHFIFANMGLDDHVFWLLGAAHLFAIQELATEAPLRRFFLEGSRA